MPNLVANKDKKQTQYKIVVGGAPQVNTGVKNNKSASQNARENARGLDLRASSPQTARTNTQAKNVITSTASPGTAHAAASAVQTPVLNAAQQRFAGKSTREKAAMVDLRDEGMTGGKGPAVSMAERIGRILAGAGESRAAGHVNTLGMLSDAQRGTAMSGVYQAQADTLDQQISVLQRIINDPTSTPQDIREAQDALRIAQQQRGIYGGALRSGQNTAREVYRIADSLARRGQANTERAKEGLGAVGRVGVDLASQGVQMAGDRLVGGPFSLAAMGARTFGSGAQEARQEGANLQQAAAYGAASAAVETLTEKMADGLAGIYGKGAADDVIRRAINKMTTSETGRRALTIAAAAGGEASEEAVSGYVNPWLKSIYNGQRRGLGRTREELADMAYDMLIGGIMGGIGGTVQAAGVTGERRADAQRRSDTQTLDAVPRNASGAGTLTVESERGAQAQEMRESGQRQYPAQTVETPQVRSDAQPKPNDTPADVVRNGGADYIKAHGEQAFVQAVERGWQDGTIKADGLGQLYEVKPEHHIDNRSRENVGDRKLPAFQFENPEIHPYYREVAAILLDELGDTQRGGQIEKYYTLDSTGVPTEHYKRTSRSATEAVERLLDDGMSYADIEKALDAIVNNHGQENFAAAKRAEIVIDDLLEQDYRSKHGRLSEIVDLDAYRQAKDAIAGAQERTEDDGEWMDELIRQEHPDYHGDFGSATGAAEAGEPQTHTVGSAEHGFETPESRGVMRDSRLKDRVLEFNRHRAEASGGLDRETYDQVFRYQSQTQAQMTQAADNLLYVEQDGQRTFLMDADEEAFREITDELRDAPAWNGAMTKAAMMIEQEYLRRSIDLEITEDVYNDWRNVMREHATETGRGSAAWADDNNIRGARTERDAWDKLQDNENLSPEQRIELFRQIMQWDKRVEQATSREDVKRVILEVAAERGTTSNAITGRQSAMLNRFAGWALDGLSDAELRQFAYQSTAALTNDGAAADVGQRIKTLQVLFMLSNPKTSARNIAGNTSFYALDTLAMRGASLLDMALSRVTGTRSIAYEQSALSGNARRAMLGAMRRSAAEVALDVDMGGRGRYNTGSNRTNKMSGNLGERVFSMFERNMGYLLTTTDEIYKGAARATQSRTQELINSGKIKNAASDYAETQADALAKYRTFQQDGRAATIIQGFHDLLNLVGWGDSGKTVKGRTVHNFGPGDMVAPFTRVAANLASVAVDYSPFKAVQGFGEIANVIADAARHRDVNPAAQAKALSDTARGMTGSLVAVAAFELAKRGLLRRADDEDDDDIAKWNAADGLVGTQLNVDAMNRWLKGGSAEWRTGDTLLDMMSLEPINAMVTLGANMAADDDDGLLSQFVDVDENRLPGAVRKGVKVAGATASSILSAAGDLPVLSGASGFAKDVFRYGRNPAVAGADALGRTAISTVTPNILSAAAKGMDEKQRNVYTGDTVAERLGDYAKSRIPGLRGKLPTVTDVTGQEKTNDGGLAKRLVNAMVNPIGVNQYTQSKVSRELQTLREETGNTGIYPGVRMPKTVSYDKNGTKREDKLSYEQRQAYQRDAAKAYIEEVEKLIDGKAYDQLSAEEKADAMAKIVVYAGAKARQNYAKEHGGSYTMTGEARTVEKATEAQQVGVDPSEYFWLKGEHDKIDKRDLSANEKATYWARFLLGQGWLNERQREKIGELQRFSGGYYGTASDKALGAEENGISLDQYFAYKDSISGLQADKDANGKSISGSKKAKVIAAINELDMTPEQKDFLYLEEGYKKADLYKTPWH